MKYNCLDNPKLKRRILEVHVNRLPDEDPDLSHLGEYSNTPDPRYCIDRKERGDMRRGEYRYFNPSSNYDGEGMDELKKYTEQDYDRMESHNNGGWCTIGIKAWARVQLNGSVVMQKITSGGLWGTESDSDAEYLTEVEDTELDALREELLAIGFTEMEIEEAFAEAKRS